MLVPLSDSIDASVGSRWGAGTCCPAVSSFRNATAVEITSWVHQRCAHSIHTEYKKYRQSSVFYPTRFFNLEFLPFIANWRPRCCQSWYTAWSSRYVSKFPENNLSRFSRRRSLARCYQHTAWNRLQAASPRVHLDSRLKPPGCCWHIFFSTI